MSLDRRVYPCLPALLAALAFLILPARPAWSQPVTVITDTMIADIGARTLKDLLITYVPGMTFSQDHNEVNVAMRGIYASAQQKILIVMDGHILNSRSYSAVSPDFSISLDKVKRIEVIRGPASALYGNGALTAVVSITTKTTADTASTGESQLRAGLGTHGQVKVSGLFGATTTKGSDVLAWGSFYKSDGETMTIPASQDYSRTPANATAILDGFRDRPSHDVGLKLKTRLFTVSAAHRYSKYIEPFSAGGPTGESYVYSDYQRGHGEGPGLSEGSLNLGVSHERVTASKVSFVIRGYFDRIEHSGHLVSDPSQRAHSQVTWSEWDAGVVAQAGSETRPSDSAKTSWRAGVQADFMRVDDSILSTGVNGGWSTTTPSGGLLALGDEQMYSAFASLTQPLGQRWTATAALRYDVKVRLEGKNLTIASPNVALTYRASARAAVALSYGRSFVDAPYFYRYNALASYRGARTLQPEYLESVQVTPTVTLGAVTWTSNLFFNHLDSLVYRNNAAAANEPIYQNAGFLRTWGIEHELGWANGPIDVKGNVTFQRASSAEKYAIAGSDVQNVPTWSGNLILNVSPTLAASQGLVFNATVRYIGEQQSPIDVTVGNRVFREPSRVVEGVALVNIGARLNTLFSQAWSLDARVYNLFDMEYEQGGSVSHPYPQPGRWAMVTLGRRW